MKNKVYEIFKRVSQVVIIFVVSFLIGLSITGCNYSGYDFVDTNYHFNKAYIKTPYGGVLVVDIAKWADSEDGEQITITDTNGNRYLVHSSNVMMIETAVNDEGLSDIYAKRNSYSTD